MENELLQEKESNYWAASSRDDIAGHLLNKKDSYFRFLESSGMLEELRTSFTKFYGNSAIDELDNGKSVITVNHYGSLVRSLHTLITQNRPAFEARAVNTDHKSQATVILANGLLDYYLREKKLEESLKLACLNALYLREGWITAEWNPNLGENYGVNPDDGGVAKDGDVEFCNYTILDIIRPVRGQVNWHIVRKYTNKYDLAAQFPEYESEILGATEKMADKRKWSLSYIADSEDEGEDDMVEMLCFYHSKTPALPEGRYIQQVANTVLTDGPLPYKRPYIFTIKAMDAIQTNFGHSNAMDLIPLQDALDTCFSIALSNINSFGVGSLVSEKGTLQVNQIKDGLLHLEHAKGSAAPQVLNLLQIPSEIFNFAEMLVKNQETISSVNSVARGNVPGQMSGTAMALVAQQALTFSSSLQQSYNSLIENVGSSLIELLQQFANTPRMAQIAGKTKKSYLQEFSSQDLLGVSRIVVDSANAFTKTTGGKVEVANNMLNSGLIVNPQQYLEVINTGNLEVMTEQQTSQNLLIKLENEWMSEGKSVIAVMTDDDSLHILEHSSIINDPAVRQDPNILQVVLNHIQEHINNAQMKSPILAQVLKQQSFAQPPMGTQPGAQISQAPPQDMQSAPTPEMPTIAGTNEQFNPQG